MVRGGISKTLIVGGITIVIAIAIIAIYYTIQSNIAGQGIKNTGIEYPVTVTDYLGRNITIYSQPTTLGIIAPDCAQIIYTLGFGNRVVLIDVYSEQLLHYLNVTVPGNITTISSIYESIPIETIITAHPSLLCVDAGFQPQLEQDTNELSAADITLIFIGGTANTNITGIENDVMLMAKALGVPKRGGEEIINNMSGVINYVRSKVLSGPRVTVATYRGTTQSMPLGTPHSLVTTLR